MEIVEFILSPSTLLRINFAERVNSFYGTAIETHGDIPKTLPGAMLIIATKTWSWSRRRGSRSNLIEQKRGLCYSLRTWSEKEETTVYAVAFAQH